MKPERPRKGDRYRVETEFVAAVLTQWRAPYTGGSDRLLPRGVEMVVLIDPPPTATAVALRPDPADTWEVELVDETDRCSGKYNGYYLVIPFVILNEHCALVSRQRSDGGT